MSANPDQQTHFFVFSLSQWAQATKLNNRCTDNGSDNDVDLDLDLDLDDDDD